MVLLYKGRILVVQRLYRCKSVKKSNTKTSLLKMLNKGYLSTFSSLVSSSLVFLYFYSFFIVFFSINSITFYTFITFIQLYYEPNNQRSTQSSKAKVIAPFHNLENNLIRITYENLWIWCKMRILCLKWPFLTLSEAFYGFTV